MTDARLITTSSEGLQPLGTAAQRSFELVTGAVRARLGADHAALFAEPVASEHGDHIDWYADRPGRAVPLADLPRDQQQALRSRLGEMVAAIRNEAAGLAESGEAEDRRLSEALFNALEIPDEEMVFALFDDGGRPRPVLVHWAWVRSAQAEVRGVLSAMEPRVTPLHTDVARRGRRVPLRWLIGLGWLMLVLMLGAILFLMIAPCGLNPAGPVFCPPGRPALAAAFSEQAAIADEITALERDIALADRSCQPVVPVLPGPDQEGADRPGTLTRRIAARGGSLGALSFVLEWQGKDDIDLSVTCPAGQSVSLKTPAACGAELVPDANANAETAVSDPIENIRFGAATPGIYKVRAHLRAARSPGDKPLTLHILRPDRAPQRYTGSVAEGQADWTMNLNISG